MIKTLYGKYFQKSKCFLYPLLGIEKTYRPIQTYLALNDEYHHRQRRLICVFNHDNTFKYEEFERNVLYSNPSYESSCVNPGGESVYIFNMNKYFKEDCDYFLKGKYSKLSDSLKKAIMEFFGEKTPEWEYIESYLYPSSYFNLYSKLLDVPVNVLEQNGELCDTYDIEKEKLLFPIKCLEKLPELV